LYDPIWCIFYRGSRSLNGYSQGLDTTFRKKTTKKKIKVAIWSPQLRICVLELEKQQVENTDCNKLEDLKKVGGKWHGVQVRSLGFRRQGGYIGKASMGQNTCNVWWCHSLSDFRTSVCSNK
jgi:hypothetical protein